MKTKVAVLIFLVLFIFSCSNDEGPDLSGDILIGEQLQAIIDSKIGEDKLVGVSVSVRVGYTERWRLQAGNSDELNLVKSDMRFGIGSITKTAIAATTLKLEEEGLLNLNDEIGDWLTLSSPNVNERIKIIQLLNHYSGLGGYFGHPDLWSTVEGDLDAPISTESLFGFIGEPRNTPGETHRYSNSNYLILSLIIEKVTGKKVGEVMREKFWAPLALDEIYFGANETVIGPVAGAWRDTDGDGTLENITEEYRAAYHSVFYGAAGIFSTASDLSMWAQHLFNGDALNQVSKNKMMNSYFDIPDATYTGYGLGVRRNVYAGRTVWGHTGGVRGYGSHMFYEPISGISVAVLNNQSRSENGPILRHELFSEIMTELIKSVK